MTGQRVMHDLGAGVAEHLRRTSSRLFTRAKAGEPRLANDIGGADNVVTNTASSTVQNVFAALAAALAALSHPRLHCRGSG